MGTVIIVLLVGCLVAWGISQRESPAPNRSAASVLPERFVVFDLETTGLSPSKHEIIEIGAIRVYRDGVRHDTLETLVKCEQKIPTRITELTGIDQSFIDSNGVSLAEALNEFRDFVENLPMVAYNADFDCGFLRAACEKAGLSYFPNDVHCVLKLARRAWPGRPSYRLSDLARDGNIATDGEHRALGDCKRTMIVFGAAAQIVGAHC